MPNKTYQHACGHCSRFLDVCPECGERGAYDGWGYSMVEMMCASVRRYGLSPNGPHRAYAAELFKNAFWPCLRCSGRGNLILPDESYRECPRCHGDGKRPTMPLPEIAALRDRVLERYPEARGGGQWPRVNVEGYD